MRTNNYSDQPRVVNRRKFLVAAGSVVGVGSLPTKVSAAGDDTIRVPKYKKSPGKVTEWMEVPRSWHEHHKHSKNALNQFNKNHLHKQGLHETGLVAADKRYGDKRGFKIQVFVDPEKFDSSVPSEEDGIRVSVEERPDENNPLCYNIGTYNLVPGGVNMYDSSPNSGLATTGYPLQDASTGEDLLLGASHPFAKCDVVSGDTTWTVDEKIGEIERGSVGLDYVLTNYSGSFSYNEIEGESGNSYTPIGYASENEIGNRVSSLFDGYSSMGCATGRTTGGLGGKNITAANTCNDFNGEGVRGDADSANGDSGGPCFDIQNGGADAELLYHVSRGTPETKKGEIYLDCIDSTVDLFNKHEGPAAYAVFNRGYEIQS